MFLLTDRLRTGDLHSRTGAEHCLDAIEAAYPTPVPPTPAPDLPAEPQAPVPEPFLPPVSQSAVEVP